MTNRDKFLAILSVLVDNDKYDIEQCMYAVDNGKVAKGLWGYAIEKTCAALAIVPELEHIRAFFSYDKL